MLNTMKPLSLKGNGILGKKVTYVTGDTQTKSDAARASAKRMIEKEGVIMFSGGSSSGVAVACPSLGQELGKIGRASCRARVCQYVEIAGVAVSLKKKQKTV